MCILITRKLSRLLPRWPFCISSKSTDRARGGVTSRILSRYGYGSAECPGTRQWCGTLKPSVRTNPQPLFIILFRLTASFMRQVYWQLFSRARRRLRLISYQETTFRTLAHLCRPTTGFCGSLWCRSILICSLCRSAHKNVKEFSAIGLD